MVFVVEGEWLVMKREWFLVSGSAGRSLLESFRMWSDAAPFASEEASSTCVLSAMSLPTQP